LTDISMTPPAPLAAANVGFTLGDVSCSGVTDSSGIASCPVTLDAAGISTLVATFAGTTQYLGSTASIGFSTLAQVQVQQPTSLVSPGATLLAAGQPATLSAILTAGTTRVSGRMVTFTLGFGVGAQTCGGITDANGAAHCTVGPANQPL